jgi:hypothetical protein
MAARAASRTCSSAVGGTEPHLSSAERSSHSVALEESPVAGRPSRAMMGSPEVIMFRSGHCWFGAALLAFIAGGSR